MTSSAPVGVTSSVAPRPRRSGTPFSSRACAGAGTGNTPCARRTVPLPTLSGDETTSVGPEPFHGERRADDVDDRVEGADFVQVHLLDRHLVNRGLGFGQPAEQGDRARLAIGDNADRSMKRLDVVEAVMVTAGR